MKIIWLLIALLPGCASLMQPSYVDLNAAQAAAQVKDKSAGVTCTKIMAAGYSLESITISLDQNSIKDGGITADGSKGCTATITSAAPPKPVK